MNKQQALNTIDEKQQIFTHVSDEVWDYAELSLMEYRSAELYCKVLEQEGFAVEKNVAGITTAFKAVYGTGKPVIGILAEYDALSGLSQVAGSTHREERVAGGCGHGCGHNMLGAGSLAAAFALKAYLEDKPGKGTVIFYGCPGEEGGAAKAFMARDGIWQELDIALSWHPNEANQVTTGTCNSCIQTEYKFTGIAAHAAGAVELGRSALDAVELMNIGVQFLREHMPDSARIHYAITDAGGNSPNVVQPTAQVLYMVRSTRVSQALELQKRVDRIAEAAAMMTDTTMVSRFIDGTSNTVSNFTLENVLYQNFQEIGVPSYTQEEWDYAKAMQATYENPRSGLPTGVTPDSPEQYKVIKEKSDNGTRALNDFLVPYAPSSKQSMGSTDVGDVSWLVPTAQIGVVTYPSKSPGHSWQNVSSGHTSIGHKGLLTAGKVLAGAAIDLYENPAIIEKAKEEFAINAEEGYTCPVPADAVPTVVGGKM